MLRGAAPLADVIDECLDSRRADRAAATVQIEHRRWRRDASRRHRSPIRDARRASSHGAICLFTDLTDVVELEEQLRLKDSLAQVGELTAGIAHEFRNGLATIHGYARLLDLERLPADMPAVRRRHPRRDRRARRRWSRNFLNFAKPADADADPGRHARIVERAAEEIRAEARRAAATVYGHAASSGWSRATKCCCGRRSATCAATRSRPAPRRMASPRITIEGDADTGAACRCASPSSTTARASSRRGAIAIFTPVLHHQGARHRPRPGAGPEDHRHAQRPDHCRQRPGGGARLTVCSRSPAPTAAA